MKLYQSLPPRRPRFHFVYFLAGGFVSSCVKNRVRPAILRYSDEVRPDRLENSENRMTTALFAQPHECSDVPVVHALWNGTR
jgi:hypothetical protein